MISFYKDLIKFVYIFIIIISSIYKINAATDSASIGAGYTLLSWYKLNTKSVSSANVSQWNIAFSTALDASIRINDASNVKLWHVVGSDATSFDEPGTLDTNGLSSDLAGVKFKQYYNSPKTWAIGAFNMGKNGFALGGDFGWGQYNQAIHQLSGKSLFIIALPNGEYKKIFIAKWANWVYTVKYANLDGSNSQSIDINTKNYEGKLFVYYSLETNEILDLEPKSTDWDIVFGKYTDVARMGDVVYENYPVIGARINPNVKVAVVSGVKNNEAQQPNLNKFTNTANAIGYNWKIFNQNTFQFIVPDTITYFVISEDDGYLYKLWFTGFVGAFGNIYFNTEKVLLSVLDEESENSSYFAIFPNVLSHGDHLNIYVSSHNKYNNFILDIFSLNGSRVYSQNFDSGITNNIISLNNLNLSVGFYTVRFLIDGKAFSQKLIVR